MLSLASQLLSVISFGTMPFQPLTPSSSTWALKTGSHSSMMRCLVRLAVNWGQRNMMIPQHFWR